MSARVLYISYDGLMEPLGQSQVLQYLKRLAATHEITLVSYEKPEDWADRERRDRVAAEASAAGIRWRPLRYHRRPTALATAYDIQAGVLHCARLVRRHGIRLVHARSYIAGAVALALKRLLGVRLVFDMRGFWADERMEGGQFPATSPVYRGIKRLERSLFANSDVVVSLTRAGAEAIRALPSLGAAPPVEVIPTCTNLEIFRPASRPGASGRADAPFVLGYVGSVGPRYLFDSVLDTFLLLLLRRPSATLRIVNRGQHAYIAERVKARGVPGGRVSVREAAFSAVGAEIAGMDAGVLFYKRAFSTLGTAPTRLGEFLACGVPCLGNHGVGDVREVLEGDGVGVTVDEFTAPALGRAVDALLELAAADGIRERCVQVARRRFALEDGVRAYDRIYRALSPGAG